MRKKILPLLNATGFLVLSAALFLASRNYGIELYLAYVFVLLGTIISFALLKYFERQHRNHLPFSIALMIPGYLCCGITWCIAFWIGVICLIPMRLFLLIEMLVFGFAALLFFLLFAASEKERESDSAARGRDAEINELLVRIDKLIVKVYELDGAEENLHKLKEKVRYSDMKSISYDYEHLWTVQQSLNEIEDEVNAVLDIGDTHCERLNELIITTINLVMQYDTISKTSKR